jgi:nucleotide-binding universal stress UspA family protein
MLKALIPVDGSENALRAVAHAVTLAKNNTALSCELLHVHQPFGIREHAYRTHEALEKMASGEAQQALQPAHAALAAAGVAHRTNSREGDLSTANVEHARQSQCDMIIMGMRGMGMVLGPVSMGSVTSRVLHDASVPVTLVK